MSSPDSGRDSSTSVEELVEEPSTFDRLFSHFHAPLVRFVAKLLDGSGLDPEDVVQDALTKAWSNRDKFDPKYRFSTWVYTIARRTALDQMRGRQRFATIRMDEVSAVESNTEARVGDTDAAHHLWRLADRVLTADQYTALWLRYGEEMTIGEVAKALSKTTVSTRVILHRARTALRNQLPDSGRGTES
ncbi:MAG: sigma-70 family RNA polymerase sigma factor [Planctomycetota bacterium]